MTENQEPGSTRGVETSTTRRIRCWNCYQAFEADADGRCPGCGTYNAARRKKSLGYRILVVFLWIDVAITLGSVVYLAASCG